MKEASRKYFNKSPAALTQEEAILLAAALPNPGLRNPAKPSAKMLRIAEAIEKRIPILASRATCLLP